MEIADQRAITKDNVKIKIDGILYYKFKDTKAACYNIKDPENAISFLAQTAMRSEIGLLDLDSMFKERESLNAKIRAHLDHTTEQWGIECMRYEIKDILPPKKIQQSMELQAEAERIKRSHILESEGRR